MEVPKIVEVVKVIEVPIVDKSESEKITSMSQTISELRSKIQ